MDFKQYLLSQSQIQLSEIAFRMWPNNKTADNYLSKKLHDKMGKRFNDNDEKLARNALKELGVKLIDVSNKMDIPDEDLGSKSAKK